MAFHNPQTRRRPGRPALCSATIQLARNQPTAYRTKHRAPGIRYAAASPQNRNPSASLTGWVSSEGRQGPLFAYLYKNYKQTSAMCQIPSRRAGANHWTTKGLERARKARKGIAWRMPFAFFAAFRDLRGPTARPPRKSCQVKKRPRRVLRTSGGVTALSVVVARANGCAAGGAACCVGY